MYCDTLIRSFDRRYLHRTYHRSFERHIDVISMLRALSKFYAIGSTTRVAPARDPDTSRYRSSFLPPSPR